MNTNKTIEEDFNELFYEGERNSTYCKKHKVLATPHEVKEFAIFEVEKATLKALPAIKNAIYEEMREKILQLEQTQSSRHDWSILTSDILSLLKPKE